MNGWGKGEPQFLAVGQREEFGGEVDGNPLPPGGKNEFFGFEGFVTLHANDDVVGAVEGEGTGDGGSADLDVVKVHEGTGWVSMN